MAADRPVRDRREIARWRLRQQHLTGPPALDVPAVVQGLLAVQAENHAQASWAVACRTSGVTEQEFAELFDRGDILRTHVIRPTWHYVHPSDIRWLIALTAPRVRRTFDQVARGLDLDVAVMTRSLEVIATALVGDNHLTRTELGACLAAAGIPTLGQAVMLLAANAELEAVICSGPMRGNEPTYALLEERAPAAPLMDRADALAHLVRRYVTSHGPATERDLAYWATLTLTDVRSGLAAVHDALDSFELDGRTYWFAGTPPDDLGPTTAAHLLQILDEYYRGYQDSRDVLDVQGLLTPGRETSTGMVLVDGQMIGHLQRTVTADQVAFDLDLFREISDDEAASLREVAAHYGRYLTRDSAVVTKRVGAVRQRSQARRV